MKNVTRDKFDHSLTYEFCADKQNKVKDGTLTGYRWTAEGFLDYLDEHSSQSIEDIDWTDVDGYINHLTKNYGDSTVKTRYNHLRSFLKWLRARKEMYRDREVLPHDHRLFDITEYIDRGKTRKAEETTASGGIIYVEAEEYELIKQHVPAPKFRNELIVKMLWHLGVRRREVVDMQIAPHQPHRDRYGNIDFDDNRVDTPGMKGSTGRKLWFRDSLAVPLRRWIESEREAVFYAEESDYLFPSRNSEQLTAKRVTSMIDEAAQNAGIQSVLYEDANGHERKRITPHACRHGFAVQHVRNGTNIKTLNDLLGHEDLSTTQIYLQFNDEPARQAQHRNAPDV